MTIHSLPTEATSSVIGPDLRILHFNDVYDIQPDTREPVGGFARFRTILERYKKKTGGDSATLTLFSGDAFNPSLESIFTKGISDSSDP
jgi:2',3'-cyclic-nucleotide 2'-phosphodiesterase (5'-nucleotidase family)